jgi:hypothetical protein
MSKPAARAALFVLSLLVFGLLAGLGGYYAGGRSDAIEDARPLARRADRLVAQGKGGPGLGVGREALLLAVLDPAAAADPRRPDAGVPILAQTLADRLASEQSTSIFGGIRRAGYASGLETRLSRSRMVALWLETVEMGRGSNGWLRGLYDASRALYGRKPDRLTDDQFIHLLALAITPGAGPNGRDPALQAQISRIRALNAVPCKDGPGSSSDPRECQQI